MLPCRRSQRKDLLSQSSTQTTFWVMFSHVEPTRPTARKKCNFPGSRMSASESLWERSQEFECLADSRWRHVALLLLLPDITLCLLRTYILCLLKAHYNMGMFVVKILWWGRPTTKVSTRIFIYNKHFVHFIFMDFRDTQKYFYTNSTYKEINTKIFQIVVLIQKRSCSCKFSLYPVVELDC